MPQVNVEPAIAMMKHDLDRANNALAQGDVLEMLRVYESLKATQP